MKLLIMKLGGSIVTEKQEGRPVVREDLLSKICTEISLFLTSSPDTQLIILHGAGSIGHPLAKEYDLSDKPANTTRMFGMAKTTTHMRQLTNDIAFALQKNAIPAMPLQTSSMFYRNEHGELLFTSQEIIENILKVNGVPVFCGDVITTTTNTTSIASADELAVLCAKTLGATRIIFATDVDGVYKTFPPQPSESCIKNMNREDVQNIITKTTMPNNPQDVTKGMEGKLQALLKLEHIDITICNGLDPANIKLALTNEQTGTKIHLKKTPPMKITSGYELKITRAENKSHERHVALLQEPATAQTHHAGERHN